MSELSDLAYTLDLKTRQWWDGEGRQEDVVHAMAVLLVEMALSLDVDDE